MKEAIRRRCSLTIEKAGEAANISLSSGQFGRSGSSRVYHTRSIDRSLLWALIVLFIDISDRRNLFLTSHRKKKNKMKPLVIGGIALMILGIVALSYNRITYTTEEKIAEIGPFKATAEKEKSIPLPPALGGLAVIAGVGLVAIGFKKP